MLKIDFQDSDLKTALGTLRLKFGNLAPAMNVIAGQMLSSVEQNFITGGRYSESGYRQGVGGPKTWKPLAKRTLKDRAKRGLGTQILVRNAKLAGSISPRSGKDYAEVGTNKVYAALQNFGGTLRITRSGTVRLKTDAKGNLKRQGTSGKLKNLARFAKKSNKRAVERSFTANFSATIPARPFLVLQEEDRAKFLETVKGFLAP